MPFAAQLQALRNAKGLTQKALADAIDTTDAYISALETGRKLPSYLTTTALARILGGDPQDLWAHVQQDKTAQAVSKAQRRHIAFVAANVALPDPGSTNIRALVQALADDPTFLQAVLNLRKALSSKGRAVVLQILEDYAQD